MKDSILSKIWAVILEFLGFERSVQPAQSTTQGNGAGRGNPHQSQPTNLPRKTPSIKGQQSVPPIKTPTAPKVRESRNPYTPRQTKFNIKNIPNIWVDALDDRMHQVKYSLTSFFPWSIDKFPIVKCPEVGTYIKNPVEGRNGNVGYSENKFIESMQRHFRGNIFNNLSLIGENGIIYSPDIAYLDTSNKIFIDIEIDEPYDGIGHQPTHCIGMDDYRDQVFTDRGWIVVRFSEKQVFQTPMSCCKFFADLLSRITLGFSIPQILKDELPLNPEKRWDEKQAKEMAFNRVREEYLGIDRFPITTTLPAEALQETLQGRKIEEMLKNEKPTNPPQRPTQKPSTPPKKPIGTRRENSKSPIIPPPPTTYEKKDAPKEQITQVPPKTFG